MYKKILDLSGFLNFKNVLKSIANPKKAVHYIKFYWDKNSKAGRDIEEIIGVYFPGKSAKATLKELENSPASAQKFYFGGAGHVDTKTLYLVSRFLKPATVVETGVASGCSSSFILQALQDNNSGKLYSIDLPQYCPPGKTPDDLIINVEGNIETTGFIPSGKEPGWLVPKDLRNRWSLILGSSQKELPKLVNSLKEIDVFYHDSEHTYKNMMFEFETVWPKIKKGGFLISDDVHWNESFNDFVKKLDKQKIKVFKNDSIGIIRKL